MLEQIRPNTLAEYVGSEFQVLVNAPRPLFITLAKIVELAKIGRQEIFSLYFHGPADIFMQQATYRLKHEKFGEVDLFLVPVGKIENGFEYECAFNNLI
jgi:hypothetical protein